MFVLQAPANETLLDMIAAAGLRVLFSTCGTGLGTFSNDTNSSMNSWGGGSNVSMTDAEAFVKEQVATYKDHEAVLGWWVCSQRSDI